MEDLKTPSLHEAIEEMITAYHEVNGPIDELHGDYRFLDRHVFGRYVAKNRPFIMRNGCNNWAATQSWNAGYLREKMEGRSVKVASTPIG